ncbi:HAD hydrolase-like protein [bacterium]|nr:HAD hydrolase-like protein [bacterium]
MRLLFDLDGTLTDPFVGITRCIQHALTSLGRNSPPADDLRWCIGPPLTDSFRVLLKTDDETMAAEALRLYRERFGEIGLFENEVYAGIMKTLQVLKERGYTMSVATSKPELYAVKIIEHFELDQFFQSIDGSQLDGTRSDKGALIRYILDRDNLDRNQSVMVGDRKHDMIGARSNHILAVGVLWGHGSLEELKAAGAFSTANDPYELPCIIKEIDHATD